MWLKDSRGEVIEVKSSGLGIASVAARPRNDMFIEITPMEPKAFLLHMPGRSVPFYGFREKNAVHLWMDGISYRFEIVHSPEITPPVNAQSSSEMIWIKAPMPGKIIKVLVKFKEKVELNQPLAVMESMKMEMTLSAPAAGEIQEVACEPGSQVKMGQSLINLEPLS